MVAQRGSNRIHYRRRHSYNTKSNSVKPIRTPGGALVAQYRSKRGSGPKCGDCKRAIIGVPHLRSVQYSRIARSQKSVSRAYGGSQCAACVRSRIIRAFLIEEQKIVKMVIKAQAKVKTAPTDEKKPEEKKTKA